MIPRHNIEVRWIDLLRSLPPLKDPRPALVQALERRFPGSRVLLMPSGRACLYYILKALPQGKVYIPAHTCRVVPEAALLAGRDIVYVDIDPTDYNMDLTDLERKLEPGGIVVATHQFGFACDIRGILDLARRRSATVVEDFAAAFGTLIDGRPAGTFGTAAFSSLEHTKVLAAGRGGFLLCNTPRIHEAVLKALRDEPLKPSGPASLKEFLKLFAYKAVTLPFVYPAFIRRFIRRHGLSADDGTLRPVKNHLYTEELSRPQAAVALRNLRRIDRIIARRRAIAEAYWKGLEGVAGIEMPRPRPGTEPSLMRFAFRVLSMSRDNFHAACLKRGLDLGLGGSYSCSPDCPRAVEAASRTLNLPFNSNLSDRQVRTVIGIIRTVTERRP